MRIAIVGFGYTGARLAAVLLERGQEVVGVARTPARWAGYTHHGFQGRVADLDAPASMRNALDGVDRVIHLAPPPREGVPEDQAAELARALPRDCDRLVYGSTTGVFEAPEDPATWVDEEWPVGPSGGLGRARLAYERALAEHSPAPLYVTRIAGIYGPGRTLADRLGNGRLRLVEGGRFTSRIHRDDLADLLAAVATAETPPPLVLACDDEPAPTLEVARYAASLLGWEPPSTVTEAEAEAGSTPRARELRRAGKRCRSLFRATLTGPLQYPTYREGLRHALGLKERTDDNVGC